LLWVSVTTSELLSTLAVMVALFGSKVARSDAAWEASIRSSGMICITISALSGICRGSLPVRIGMERLRASSFELTTSVRPLRTAV